jgi:hypothetical protein
MEVRAQKQSPWLLACPERDAAEVLGNFWKIQREYKKWKHKLDFCRLGFEQNLEEFLLPLIADEDEL